jgi:histidinol dehydrogenase
VGEGRMTHAQIQAHKYTAAILLADITEERVRNAEILAPHWFTLAYIDAWRLLERISAESSR